jgi:hypothetical protein
MPPSAYSFRAIVSALSAFFVEIDTGLLGMLRRLCTSPGALVARQLALPDKVFREPLRLFVFANLVFFLLAPQVGLFQYSLGSLAGEPGIHAEVTQRQQEASGLDRAVYEERFDNHLDFRQPTFAILLVPLLALMAKLFDLRRPYGVQLMVSLYAVSWILLSWPVLLLAADTLFRITGFADPATMGFTKLMLLLLSTLQWFARVQAGGFGRRTGAAILMGALLTGGWVLVMAGYAQIVFWLTWSLLPTG